MAGTQKLEKSNRKRRFFQGDDSTYTVNVVHVQVYSAAAGVDNSRVFYIKPRHVIGGRWASRCSPVERGICVYAREGRRPHLEKI